ncbi:hypothetical protein BRADI_1g58876v3 [Brachypodium distachyon]|uniref:F-box domain-containing protein n=2 Tax=Brachypodium distachyon TaxID=15368 RepID=A0A0Q3K9J8_BRADI|nr:hypothetical protein BRADI_1g58876v3 [Brachypodium distachyon]
MPPLPPALLDELLEEVFLRLPPDEPDHLVRASSVCKLWRRLIAGRGFRRRYLKFHGAPPVLGLLHNGGRTFPSGARFVPTSASRSRPADHVLPDWIRRNVKEISGLLVWDPVTGDRRHVPSPNMSFTLGFGAAVLCAAQGCDHCSCHRGPFNVALVAIGQGREITACLYSSETGTWSQLASIQHPHDYPYCCAKHMRSVLVGDALYFIGMKDQIIEYRPGTLRLSLFDLLPKGRAMIFGKLMMAEDGGLGFAKPDGATLTLWSRKTSPNGAVGWAQRLVINLETLLPPGALLVPSEPCMAGVFGFVEGTQVIFVGTSARVYMVELESGQVRKVLDQGYHGTVVFPYTSFPAMGAARTGQGQ